MIICNVLAIFGLPIAKLITDNIEAHIGKILITFFHVTIPEIMLITTNNISHKLLFAHLCFLFKNIVSRIIDIPQVTAPVHAQSKLQCIVQTISANNLTKSSFSLLFCQKIIAFPTVPIIPKNIDIITECFISAHHCSQNHKNVL